MEILSNYMKQLKKNRARAKPAGKIAKTRDPSWGYGFGGGMSFATPTRTLRTRTRNPRRVSKPVIFPTNVQCLILLRLSDDLSPNTPLQIDTNPISLTCF